MLDRWRGNEEGKEPDDQQYRRALTAVYQQVRKVMADVDGIGNHLAATYPERALSQLSRRFEAISKDFSTYTLATNHMFYEVFRRSRLRTNAATKVAQRAKSVAQLFERYSRNPKSYSAVNSRLEINKLQVALQNLLGYCI